ncbi:MAG: sodium pump decarboxylase subunit gamma [Chloroflexi bacterium]|nr:MAG: sodium pump decarboxylase subunit gamma [Chloroflexota bacterium]
MNSMRIALEITALGMGLVFAAIILLWWMMNLLTFITADKDTSQAPGADPVPDLAKPAPAIDSESKALAAAVAVAVALADQQAARAHPFSDPPTAIVSAWQLGTRTRQLYQNGPIRRPRKIG